MKKRKNHTKRNIFIARCLAVFIAAILIVSLARILFYQKPTQEPQFKKTSHPKAENKIISWRDAANYYGQHVTVEGEIVATHKTKKVCFLNFHHNYKKYFTVVIFASEFYRFPDNIEGYYAGKRIRVTGLVKEYTGKPEIIVNDPSQIEVLP